MEFYRGDDRGPAAIKAAGGFAPKDPKELALARTWLRDEMRKPNDFMMKVTRWPCEHVVAASRTSDGAYGHKNFFYKIVIPDDTLKLEVLDNKGQAVSSHNGAAAGAQSKSNDANKLVHNNSIYEQATIVAYLHKQIDTREATFVASVPYEYIKGYRPKTAADTDPFLPMP